MIRINEPRSDGTDLRTREQRPQPVVPPGRQHLNVIVDEDQYVAASVGGGKIVEPGPVEDPFIDDQVEAPGRGAGQKEGFRRGIGRAVVDNAQRHAVWTRAGRH